MLTVFNDGGPAHELDALAAPGPAWLGIDTGTAGRRPAIGAAVTVELPDGARRHRRVHRDGSYCSSQDPGVLVGLGAHRAAASVRIDWPGGGAIRLERPPSNRYLRFVP